LRGEYESVNILGPRYAVTGATGFLGQHLVAQLLSQGASVSALVRTPNLPADLLHPAVRLVHGSLLDAAALRALVDDSQVIFHLAAYVHKQTLSREQIAECYQVNLECTRLFVDECARQTSPPFFVFFSTTSVYGRVCDIADEATPCAPETPYGRSKLEAEHYLLERIAAGDLRGCVLRPSMTFGEGAPGNLTRMMRLVARGLLPLFDGGRNLKSITYVDNVIHGSLLCAQYQNVTNGGVYIVTDDVPRTMAEIGHLLAQALDVRPLVLRVPVCPVKLLVGTWDHIARATRGKLPVLGRSLEVYVTNSAFSNAKIKKQLSFEPQVTLEDGIQRMARWYRRERLHTW